MSGMVLYSGEEPSEKKINGLDSQLQIINHPSIHPLIYSQIFVEHLLQARHALGTWVKILSQKEAAPAYRVFNIKSRWFVEQILKLAMISKRSN